MAHEYCSYTGVRVCLSLNRTFHQEHPPISCLFLLSRKGLTTVDFVERATNTKKT